MVRFIDSGRYTCDLPLSVPTRGDFYISKLSLECLHVPGETDIVLGSDWFTGFSTTFCCDTVELELEDPATSVVAFLLVGHYWNPNDGAIACLSPIVLTNVCFLADTRTLCADAIDVDNVLSKLNQCSSDPKFDLHAFFTAHAVEFDDVSLTREDVMSHFLNGQCAGRKAPGCHEVAHDVRYPVGMALATTEAVVVSCE